MLNEQNECMHCLLEILGLTKKSSIGALRFGNFIKLRIIGRIGKLPFGDGSNKYLKHGSERASSGSPIPIKRPSHQENNQRQSHNPCEDKISSSPIHMVLHIHNQCHSKNKATTKATVPPVEE